MRVGGLACGFTETKIVAFKQYTKGKEKEHVNYHQNEWINIQSKYTHATANYDFYKYCFYGYHRPRITF